MFYQSNINVGCISHHDKAKNYDHIGEALRNIFLEMTKTETKEIFSWFFLYLPKCRRILWIYFGVYFLMHLKILHFWRDSLQVGIFLPIQVNFATSFLLNIHFNKDISVRKRLSCTGLIHWIESNNWWSSMGHYWNLILYSPLGLQCNISLKKLASQEQASAASTCIKVSAAVAFLTILKSSQNSTFLATLCHYHPP